MTSDPIGLNGGPNTYAYSLNNPVRLVDRLGLFSFVAHYFTGNGAPVDLASVGLLDDFQNAETVVWATDGFKTMVKLEAALRARKACDPCDTGTKDSSFSMSDSVVTDVTLEENLFAVGNSQFFRNAECNMSVDCDNKTYSYNCILGYHIRDRFADPIDMGIEIVGGTPYEINAAWVTSCSGSGSF